VSSSPAPSRPARRKPLDAALVPLERALLARAQALEDGLENISPMEAFPDAIRFRRELAAEYRALAGELHQ